MKLTIKESAQTYLKDHLSDNAIVFLATDDGASKFSKLGGSCAIGNKFQLVVSPSLDKDYNIPLENNTNYQMFISNDETTYLGNGLTLAYANGGLVLKDDSGLLDGAVTIGKADTAVLTGIVTKRADEMKALGGKIC